MKEMYGIYRGVVKDNDDPQKTFRLRVLVPHVYGPEANIEELPWAEPCYPLLGGNNKDNDSNIATHGVYSLPTLESTVWVMFEGGFISRPVWLGTWLSSKDIPQEALEDYPNNTLIKFPSGFYFKVTDSKLTIGFRDPELDVDRATLVFDKDARKVTLDTAPSEDADSWSLSINGKNLDLTGYQLFSDRDRARADGSKISIKFSDIEIIANNLARVGIPTGDIKIISAGNLKEMSKTGSHPHKDGHW